MSAILNLLASILAVFLVFVPHEIAHGYIAYKNGDGTAKMMGRLTLNPIKHIDPLGFVMCVFTGFGWAKPVPINPSNFRNYKKGLFTTAIAGVVTNYIIAFIVYPLCIVFLNFVPTETIAAVYAVDFFVELFGLTYIYSLSVFVFNLLPFYPLDGFRVVESLTRQINPVRRFLQNYGFYILIFLVIESYACTLVQSYTTYTFIKYFDILGYVQWFARYIIGYPISALWNLILKPTKYFISPAIVFI
jgi:Zn-dependent protease